MVKSNQVKDYSKYIKLKALNYAKSIKTIANWEYFDWTEGVLCQKKVTTFK